MKRKISVICLVLSLFVMSVKGEERKNEIRITPSYDIGIDKGSGGVLNLNPEFGHYFSDQLFLGIGTGVSTDNKFSSFAIPVYGHAEINFPASKVTPFVSLKAGYNIATGDNKGCAVINPSIGVKIPLTEKIDLALGCGYTRTIVNGGGANYLGFNVGINFDSNGKGFSNFLKTLVYAAEIEMYTGISYPESMIVSASQGERRIALSSLFGIRLNVLAPIFENCYLGPSIGVGHYTEKESSYSSSEMYFNAMLRAKYNVTQITFLSKFYPFAQVDLGYSDFARGEGFFSVSPAAGVAYNLTDNSAAYLSVGYFTIDHFGNKKGSARIALGFQF